MSVSIVSNRKIFFTDMVKAYRDAYDKDLNHSVNYPDWQPNSKGFQLIIKEVLSTDMLNWMVAYSIKTDTAYYVDRGVINWNLKKPAR